MLGYVQVLQAAMVLLGPRHVGTLACSSSPLHASRYVSLDLSGSALAAALPRGQVLSSVTVCGVEVWALRPSVLLPHIAMPNRSSPSLTTPVPVSGIGQDLPVMLASRQRKVCIGHSAGMPVAAVDEPQLAVGGLYLHADGMCANLVMAPS